MRFWRLNHILMGTSGEKELYELSEIFFIFDHSKGDITKNLLKWDVKRVSVWLMINVRSKYSPQTPF